MRTLPISASLILSLALAGSLVVACSPADPSGEGDGFETGGNGSTSGGSAGVGGGAGNGASGNGGSSSGGNGGIILDDGGGQGGTGNGGGLDECATSEAKAEFTPALIELLVDSSGSMAFPAPNTTLSKWDVTSAALRAAVPKLPDSTALGLIFFPDLSIYSTGCFSKKEKVVIGPLSSPGQRDRIDKAIAEMSPLGGTPTHAGYDYAAHRVAALTIPGNKFVILITDGEPTYNLDCSGDGRTPVDNEPLTAAVQSFAQQGVRTFVVGVPGSENARRTLSRMASLGGTARAGCSDTGPSFCHFDMTTAADFGAALADGLAKISGSTLSCEFDVPAPPAGETLDKDKVNVRLAKAGGQPELVLKGKETDCAEGWQYSTDGKKVVLCPATCDAARASSGASVEVVFGCATQEVPQ